MANVGYGVMDNDLPHSWVEIPNTVVAGSIAGGALCSAVTNGHHRVEEGIEECTSHRNKIGILSVDSNLMGHQISQIPVLFRCLKPL